ncbi:MAG: hypothetical protein N2509_08750, partial [Treponemataceae bacterium]|nr:hypothetical protein [Treponemataceae bacterium]
MYKFLGFFFRKKACFREISGKENIIFISCFYIGDCLFLTPIYREVKKKYPKIKITAIVNDPSAKSLLQSNPYIDHLVFVQNYLQALLFVLNNLRVKYDILMDYSSLFWWSFVFRFLRANLRVARQNQHRVGHFLLDDFSWLHDQVVPYRGQYIVDYYAQIMEETGVPIPHRQMEIFLDPREVCQTLHSYHLDGARYFILHPGARNRENLWYRWPELVHSLRRAYPQHLLVLTGTRQDAERLGEVISSPAFSDPQVFSLMGKTTIKEMAALISCCEGFIGGDTGASHVAIALQKPTVML